MRNLLKLFLVPVCAGAAVVMAAGAAESGRATHARTSRASTARMPTMPTLPINSIGNMSPNLPTTPSVPTPPKPDDPNQPDNPDNPDNPDKPDVPTPECSDGGVKNSDYTVDRCMTDVLACVNNGALPGGLNDLFNEDLRNSIVNGMGICTVQIDKCVSEVRRDCRNVYRTAADVWLDFNTRKVQPEYYSFVLRKTGLTPYQAENTCLLLDKNTFGSSFNAVANGGAVTSEYNNRVGAYNGQAGGLQKAAPQGVRVNNNNPGVDGQRGHYARWDATTADCWIRVAAYNKDSQIKNSWLFGALGDDQPAEVWRKTGDTFTCNKDLFGFSLLNKTSTAAVVGIGGGTVVGAGVGAIAGHGAREFDCTNKSHLKELGKELRETRNIEILNEYLDGDHRLPVPGDVTTDFCYDIVRLNNVYHQMHSALKKCSGAVVESGVEYEVVLRCERVGQVVDEDTDYQQLCFGAGQFCEGLSSIGQCRAKVMAECAGRGRDCLVALDVVESVEEHPYVEGECVFKPINIAKRDGESIYCDKSPECKAANDIEADVNRLGRVLSQLEILNGEDSNMVGATLAGAGIGAGVGGLATVITTFVEQNNIHCRVGDGLSQVGFKKSHSIGSLKDFYVKWDLRLPDTVAPTAQVVDCASWKSACAMFNNERDCTSAQINYKPAGAATTTLIRAACAMSGSVCIENHSVAKSYGACE